MTEPDQNRLDQLQERIDEAREDLAEETGTDDEPRFIDRGEAGGPVDDTIAPPG